MYAAFVFRLAAGFGLFFTGVRVIRSGLEGAAEAGLRSALAFLAGTPARGVALGALVTGAIQSSTVTTTLVVAFAGARAITLRQAIGLILGANIGATVAIQILALNAHRYAPLVILVGVCLSCVSCLSCVAEAQPRSLGTLRHTSRIIVGVGLLFSGLRLIAVAVGPITSGARFAAIAHALGEHPILGFLGGIVITASVQSSSVTIAAMSAACSLGRLTLAGAVPVIIGANVGTCMTAIVAALCSTVHARRAAIAHLLFNAACAGLFMAFLRSFVAFTSRTSPSIASQVANAHTLFNVSGALMALPFIDTVAAVVEGLTPGPRD